MGRMPYGTAISHPEFQEFQRDLVAVYDALFFLDATSLGSIQRTIHQEAMRSALDAVNTAHAVKFQFLSAHTRVSMLRLAPAIASLREQLERAPDGSVAVRAARKGLSMLNQVGEAVPSGIDCRRTA